MSAPIRPGTLRAIEAVGREIDSGISTRHSVARLITSALVLGTESAAQIALAEVQDWIDTSTKPPMSADTIALVEGSVW